MQTLLVHREDCSDFFCSLLRCVLLTECAVVQKIFNAAVKTDWYARVDQVSERSKNGRL